jgi:hypothetical protein
MRRPPLALALAAAATGAAGALAAGALAQSVPPFQPEPTTTAPTTTTEPAPAPDASGPVIAIQLPKTRTGSRIKRVRITFREPDSSVAYAQVDVKRRIRLSTGVKDQSYDGRSWFTNARNSAKYRLRPKVDGRVASYTLTFRKGLPAARYWITVLAQNEPGTDRTKTVSFRTR